MASISVRDQKIEQQVRIFPVILIDYKITFVWFKSI